MAYIMCPFVERLSLSPTAYSQIVAQQRPMPKCTITVSQLVAFFLSNVFSAFFHWMRPSKLLAVILSRFGHRPGYYTTIDFWFGLAHPSDAKSSVISQMSLSQYHMSGVYNILSQVGRFAFKHIRLMSCLMSLQSCCPHDECIHSFRVACV